MDAVEVPDHFICPISLEIMKDPVTTMTGITYDRASIELWLFTSTRCPVTMLPLSGRSNLTPNHTLHRLIQTWSSPNTTHDTGPTPITPLDKSQVISLIHDLRHHPDPLTKLKSIQKLEYLANKSERNRVLLAEADLADALISFMVSCHENRCMKGLEEALTIFHLFQPNPSGPMNPDEPIIASLLWVLREEWIDDHATVVVKLLAAGLLMAIVQRAGPTTLEHLRPEFFAAVLSSLRLENSVPQEGVVSLLHLLLETCSWSRNRAAMVEAGAVGELIEVEARGDGERRTTELVLEILCHLCSCAGGRAQLVDHPYGIRAVMRRVLRVSPAADESAVYVLWLVSKYTGGAGQVVREMARAGVVAKLCLVMQASDRGSHLKEKAKEVLRMHAGFWNGLPRDMLKRVFN